MKTTRILLFIAFLLLSYIMHAQPYEHAGGIRAGYSSGITYKGFFLHRMSAIEVDALYNRHGLNLSALYEFHLEPFRKSRWLAYFGGGIFGGKWEGELSTGLAVIGGMEYTLREVPLNFGLDWKPMLNIYREFEPDFLDFGITIRYRFSL
jgi:hypothetical protein